MTAIVTRGDAGNLHLPDETVDLIVTSPPYFGLRSYQDGGEHYADQIGAEATPAEYLDALMACTAEWMRVLKPGGSIFVNLGDKYAGNGAPSRHGQGATGLQDFGAKTLRIGVGDKHIKRDMGVPTKSLTALPWRYAIRCIDELGLILRAEIVWAKPNGLPESVTDRVRRSHEQVFHFVKQPRYYSAVDEVREPHAEFRPAGIGNGGKTAGSTEAHRERSDMKNAGIVGLRPAQNPLGKLPGSVWTIPTAPLRVPEELGIDHFAAYPPELVRRIVLGWSPREVCTACGEGRRPVRGGAWHYHPPGNTHAEEALARAERLELSAADVVEKYGNVINTARGRTSNSGKEYSDGTLALADVLGGRLYAFQLKSLLKRERSGYACACPDTTAPATPGVVLDPFGGTGTSALVASVHGRVGISVDLSADYVRLAQWRTTDEKQRAKAAGIKPKAPKKVKPEPVAEVIDLPTGQLDLLSEEWTA